jgi:hypothetical protein
MEYILAADRFTSIIIGRTGPTLPTRKSARKTLPRFSLKRIGEALLQSSNKS